MVQYVAILPREEVAMSADDGIYILKTPRSDDHNFFEYRVAWLQAIENLEWDADKSCNTDNPDVNIYNARQMWSNATVWHNVADALKYAEEKDRARRTEYGIKTIAIDRCFYTSNTQKPPQRSTAQIRADILAGNKVFWIIWSPQGSTPPSYVHASKAEAKNEMEKLAKSYPRQFFYLLRAEEKTETQTKVEVQTHELSL